MENIFFFEVKNVIFASLQERFRSLLEADIFYEISTEFPCLVAQGAIPGICTELGEMVSALHRLLTTSSALH